MAWRGSVSRSLLAAARSSPRRPTPALPRLRPPSPTAPRLPRRRTSSASARSLGELRCVQLLLPLQAVAATPRLTSHLSVSARACCELSQAGT
ncbi:uncharacterized protein LOC103969474 isoform X2 [Musa acuminata AAA Group]|uniref:uncharacterized protein LOC103969474 isoform X2 n=1 Tax=Musa acuminata AAA Group TaxID=214697 RepID=UPI0031D9827C